jgi:transcriptional/translational regulatory protein YebC/TACO1
MRPAAFAFKDLTPFPPSSMASDRTWARLRRRLAGGRSPSVPGTAPLWLEGYAPGGTAVLVLCACADPDRTRAEIRDLLKERGGVLGAPGCLAYLFRQSGVLKFAPGTDGERVAQLAYAAGAEEVVGTADGGLEVLTAPRCLTRVRAHVAGHLAGPPAEKGGGEPADALVTWRSDGDVPLEAAQARQMLQLLLDLERRGDVWSVYSNAQIPDEIVAEL